MEGEVTRPTAILYINSFYFGCTTLTTIGYGDFKPFSSDNRIFFFVVFVNGIIFYTMIFEKVSTHMKRLVKSPQAWAVEENA